MNTLNSFEGGSARFPRWHEEFAESAETGFCGPSEAEVGFLLPQLISTPGCPSRSRAVEFGAALVRWIKRIR
ncbi:MULTISPECIES: hypothetical protein [Pseudomonas aeruginosa group]|uniref:hypothetical protein n=1 Tax=Pseudomonas aeruginosa group TaxID=136841 RepID=UPI001F441D8D|nr:MULTISPECIES: hypothetical protein [Pseudomonas aeruginosa group]MCP1648079.1 hypothetical protein [Pseudomonas nitroreducens]MCP1686655.1 hypothetical protein [Pseudomonas nitroreducens]